MKHGGRYVSAKKQILNEKIVSSCPLCQDVNIICDKCNDPLEPKDECFCYGTGIHLCPRCGRYVR